MISWILIILAALKLAKTELNRHKAMKEKGALIFPIIWQEESGLRMSGFIMGLAMVACSFGC